MQFIVTTHSPFIVQSVNSQNVIALDSQNAPISPNNRGIEEILACEMGMQGMLRSKTYRTKQKLAKNTSNWSKLANRVRQKLKK